MIPRRTLLGLLGGGVVAGPQTFNAVAGQIGMAESAYTSDLMTSGTGDGLRSLVESPPDPIEMLREQISEELWSGFERQRGAEQDVANGVMPARIASPRSWSRAFREHQMIQEAHQRNRVNQLYRTDDIELLRRLAKIMGIPT